mmetsp:Transcript_857/g.853  ORF Transcript_857/g.853 Transcript_857/m.853 type:complete len:101 (-) Transcript_857:49-351(-)
MKTGRNKKKQGRYKSPALHKRRKYGVSKKNNNIESIDIARKPKLNKKTLGVNTTLSVPTKMMLKNGSKNSNRLGSYQKNENLASRRNSSKMTYEGILNDF